MSVPGENLPESLGIFLRRMQLSIDKKIDEGFVLLGEKTQVQPNAPDVIESAGQLYKAQKLGDVKGDQTLIGFCKMKGASGVYALYYDESKEDTPEAFDVVPCFNTVPYED